MSRRAPEITCSDCRHSFRLNQQNAIRNSYDDGIFNHLWAKCPNVGCPGFRVWFFRNMPSHMRQSVEQLTYAQHHELVPDDIAGIYFQYFRYMPPHRRALTAADEQALLAASTRLDGFTYPNDIVRSAWTPPS